MKNGVNIKYRLNALVLIACTLFVFVLNGNIQNDFTAQEQVEHSESKKKEKKDTSIKAISFEATISSGFNLPQVFTNIPVPNFKVIEVKEVIKHEVLSGFLLPFIHTTLTRIIVINAP